MEKIWAVRGAITIKSDQAEAVLEAAQELLVRLMERNAIQTTAIVSIIFTVTPDIKSEFPAVAVRKLGLTDIPLLCAQEIPKTGALPFCIRVLLHFYTELERSQLEPVYLRDAVKLRPDLFKE
jgi:chorismate mutase